MLDEVRGELEHPLVQVLGLGRLVLDGLLLPGPGELPLDLLEPIFIFQKLHVRLGKSLLREEVHLIAAYFHILEDPRLLLRAVQQAIAVN